MKKRSNQMQVISFQSLYHLEKTILLRRMLHTKKPLFVQLKLPNEFLIRSHLESFSSICQKDDFIYFQYENGSTLFSPSQILEVETLSSNVSKKFPHEDLVHLNNILPLIIL